VRAAGLAELAASRLPPNCELKRDALVFSGHVASALKCFPCDRRAVTESVIVWRGACRYYLTGSDAFRLKLRAQ
jgi:hypothetical protein